jgi:hypothetical protein
MNCSATKNRSGVTGVYFCNSRFRFMATIYNKGKYIRLGSFKDLFEAICARKSAQNKYGYHANHGQVKES